MNAGLTLKISEVDFRKSVRQNLLRVYLNEAVAAAPTDREEILRFRNWVRDLYEDKLPDLFEDLEDKKLSRTYAGTDSENFKRAWALWGRKWQGHEWKEEGKEDLYRYHPDDKTFSWKAPGKPWQNISNEEEIAAIKSTWSGPSNSPPWSSSPSSDVESSDSEYYEVEIDRKSLMEEAKLESWQDIEEFEDREKGLVNSMLRTAALKLAKKHWDEKNIEIPESNKTITILVGRDQEDSLGKLKAIKVFSSPDPNFTRENDDWLDRVGRPIVFWNPDFSSGDTGEEDPSEPARDLKRFPIYYPGTRMTAFHIRLPASYAKFTDGGGAGVFSIFDPRTIARIEADPDAKERPFTIRWGSYQGMDPRFSIFQDEEIPDIRDIEKVTLRGNLKIDQIKKSNIYKAYEIMKKALNVLRRDQVQFTGLSRKYQKEFRKLLVSVDQLENRTYDSLIIKLKDGDPKARYRFYKNEQGGQIFGEMLAGIVDFVLRRRSAFDPKRLRGKIASIKAERDQSEKRRLIGNLLPVPDAEETLDEGRNVLAGVINRIEEALLTRDLGTGKVDKSRDRGYSKAGAPGTSIAAAVGAAAIGTKIYEKITGGKEVEFIEGVAVLEDGTKVSRPIGLSSAKITSGPGERDLGFHRAIDISGGVVGRTRILAIGSGTVDTAYTAQNGVSNSCGTHVVIKHDPPIKIGDVQIIKSVYCHLASLSVADGASVSPGQEIGRYGGDPPDTTHPYDTPAGHSTGAHLHLGLNGSADPGVYGAYMAAVTKGDLAADLGIEVEEGPKSLPPKIPTSKPPSIPSNP